MYLLLCSLCFGGKRSDIPTCVTVWIMGLVNDKSQEEVHTGLQDDTKLQLKQPSLDPKFFAVYIPWEWRTGLTRVHIYGVLQSFHLLMKSASSTAYMGALTKANPSNPTHYLYPVHRRQKSALLATAKESLATYKLSCLRCNLASSPCRSFPTSCFSSLERNWSLLTVQLWICCPMQKLNSLLVHAWPLPSNCRVQVAIWRSSPDEIFQGLVYAHNLGWFVEFQFCNLHTT